MPPLVKEPAKALDFYCKSLCKSLEKWYVLTAPARPADPEGHCNEGGSSWGTCSKEYTLSGKPELPVVGLHWVLGRSCAMLSPCGCNHTSQGSSQFLFQMGLGLEEGGSLLGVCCW